MQTIFLYVSRCSKKKGKIVFTKLNFIYLKAILWKVLKQHSNKTTSGLGGHYALFLSGPVLCRALLSENISAPSLVGPSGLPITLTYAFRQRVLRVNSFLFWCYQKKIFNGFDVLAFLGLCHTHCVNNIHVSWIFGSTKIMKYLILENFWYTIFDWSFIKQLLKNYKEIK